MEASPTKYEFEQLHGNTPHKNYAVLPHGTYLEVIEDKEYQKQYQDLETEEEKEWRLSARNLINIEKPKYEKARKLYKKALNKNPQNAQIHTLIGNSYYEEKKYTEALSYFNKAIQLNPIDYLARWLSAEIYIRQGRIDTAIYTLTLAHIYNRNHPRLFKRLLEVLNQEQTVFYNNWSFDPQMYLYKDGETVVITADGIWLTYGMYKAVWKYDTDYQFIKEQQAVSDYLFQQEMEAIIGTFMTYNNLKKDDKRNNPIMNAFGNCLDQEMVEEFVMYEILLKENPSIAFHITEDFMKRIIRYITKIRSIDYTKSINQE